MKRFTDTDLWEKEWFMNLTANEKLAWMYIKDKCDGAGVWKPNFSLAELFIGGIIDWEVLAKKVNGNIEILPNKKWFLPDFCEFQYKELRWECKPHRHYIRLLQKHGLYERVTKGYGKGTETHLGTPQEKEKEKELEKELEKDKDKDKDYRRRLEQAEIRRTISRENKARDYQR